MDRQEIADRLRALRRSLEAPFAAAQAAGDQAEMDRLTGIAGEIDDVLAALALASLESLAASLTEIKAKIEKKTAKAKKAAESFAGLSIAKLTEEVRKILAESEEEVAKAAPVPVAPALEPPEPKVSATPPQETVAAVATAAIVVRRPVAPPEDPTAGSAGEVTAEAAAAAEAPRAASAPAGPLVLTEAHLIALWRRSLYPISGRGIIVFGLRGARPASLGGAGFADGHEIVMTPVNYRTMNCLLGQWRPGAGFAVFPGSTVPFGATVEAKIAANGVGANQMGRGRYKRYDVGWHKRSEGPAGHWALRQGCQITLQRSGDDSDYDLKDRWEVGWSAGDNIHCAFHMGEGADLANVKFSSAGCQTVAGTVKKGVPGSEAGPWATFIEPFRDRLGSQKQTEYVLFGALEAQDMIRTGCAGKTVILRYGSAGPLVEELQAALNAKTGAGIGIDGDFGPATFNALVGFQTLNFGEEADDGICGPQVAEALGLTLPAFDFADAAAGGPGHAGPVRTAAPAGGAAAVAAVPGNLGAVATDIELVWGKVTREMHGDAFNRRVVEIANGLGCDPNNLMAVMAFETGATFDPAVTNAAGSGATGLIQFMPRTAEGLGTTTKKLAKMSGLEQLEFVEKHFRSVAGSGPLPQLSDVYMCVLLPSAIGKPDSHVLFSKGTKAYDQNKGLDVNGDGFVTKLEATAKVQKKKEQGRTKTRFG